MKLPAKTPARRKTARAGAQQPVAPLERLAQGLVAAQRGAGAAGEHAKAFVQPLTHTRDAEQRHTPGDQG